MNRRLAAVAAAILLPSSGLVAFGIPALAAPDAPPAADAASPAMLGALQRDLGLTATEARARLAREDTASKKDVQLR
jgi:streptogrisin C